MLIFTGSAGTSFLILYSTDSAVSPVFERILEAFVTVVILFSALSFALYNHLDGITKDLPKDLRTTKPEAYEYALKSIEDLKKEVIVNVVLITILLITEKILYGVYQITEKEGWCVPDWAAWFFLSARSACLIVSIYAVIVQFHGFFIANELRSVLCRNST